ncbi:hypothetical protein AB0K09_06300 [Streptomyces sp. NPDC049577]|uniref:hypothetical protein n=1 Tax=Streptomyces sp. NPDC049577 TaxID=3155153 RepID=UPI0034220AEF
MAALAVVRDLREHWAPASAEELQSMPLNVLPPALFYERMPSRNSTNGSRRRSLPTRPGN